MKTNKEKVESVKDLLHEKVKSNIKVTNNKILLQVLRKKDSGIISLTEEQKKFETYFPVLVSGSPLVDVGDYVCLKPGKQYGITKLYGMDFMILDTYDIDHIVSQEYAMESDSYEGKEKNIESLLNEAKKESTLFSDVKEKEDDKVKAPTILGKYKN
jgi:hypothetical protein